MTDTRDLSLAILPRVKKLMVDSEDDFKGNIKGWLSSKGWLTRFVGASLLEPMWQLIIGPLLPTIVKIIVDIVIGSIAPPLLPMIPLINKIIDFISHEILKDDAREQIKGIMEVVENFKATPQLQAALDISQAEKLQMISSQEYFKEMI